MGIQIFFHLCRYNQTLREFRQAFSVVNFSTVDLTDSIAMSMPKLNCQALQLKEKFDESVTNFTNFSSNKFFIEIAINM